MYAIRSYYALLFIAPVSFKTKGMRKNIPIDWNTVPMIMAERGLGRQRLDNWFKQGGIQPNIYAQVAGNEAIITMVSLGCGIGVVPSLVLEKSPMRDQVVILDVITSYSIHYTKLYDVTVRASPATGAI